MHRTKRLLISILTLLCCCTGAWATGELNGLFTINASGVKVQFSQGNLQYFCSTSAPEWRFAEHQYDYVDFDISAYAANSGKWIDLFAHGTSGYDNGQTNYQPYVVGAGAGTYYQGNLTGNADWGYNAISNGGNTENSGWRTLTKAEWLYVFSDRSNAASKYGHGSINGVNGMILLPDSWTLPDGLSFTPGNSQFANSYTLEQWALMEAAGAVFLPASGSCNSSGIPSESLQNQNGFYRASTAAYYIHFKENAFYHCTSSFFQYGDAVRLVKDYRLQQDGEGNYLIGSVRDWKDFATIVNNGTNPAANAKMTADIDLCTDVTMVGSTSGNPYKGVFDGQGHKLTVNWSVNSGGDGVAPFRFIDGATIKKLHVDGSISATGSTQRVATSIVAYSIGNATSTISECWSSASITSYDTMGGIFGVAYDGASTVNITDCLFTGSISPTHSNEGCSAGFASQAMKDGSNVPTINITRGLYMGSYTGSTVRCYNFVRNDYPDLFGTHIVTDCYYKDVYGTAQGTQATAEQLSDGTTTTALNAGRTGDEAVWVQDPVTNQPMLKLFALNTDASGNYLLGSAVDWKEFAAIVNNGTNPAANAKLTADIDLGDEQTIIGSSAHPYAGVFDGQGYTLTVHLNSASDGVAPFRSIDGATIKNLAVAGSVTGAIHCAGLVGGMPEHSAFNLISNVMVSATITTTGTHCGGILGHGGSTTNTTIQDCLFNGTINGKDGGSTVGVIWGWQTYGSVNIIRCLENGTYTNCSTFDPLFKGWGPSVGSCSNNYYVNGSSEYGTQANATTLSDGTVTEGLNAGRTGDEAAWVQNPVTNQPMLKPFALNTDASGNYLIGSVRDWKDFAAIVNNGTNPAANAKMTADIDLGDDQTRIGSTSDSNTALHYKGIFDGQGHTLKIAFVETGGSNLCAPFNKLDGATIKNLHIKGTITTAGIHGAGVASDARGTTTIMNVWSEVDVTSTHSGWDECSGIVGCMKANSLTISDCLFSGSVTASSSYNGGFIGYKDSGSASIVNSLSTGTFNYTNNQDFARGASVSNSYYTQFVGSTTGMTLATSEQLSNGTTTTALNNGRTGDEAVWVQDIVANQPMLKIFYQHSFIPGDANGDGLVNVTDIVATVNYIMENPTGTFDKVAADVNKDGFINVSDIVAMVNIIMTSGSRMDQQEVMAVLKEYGFIFKAN